MASIKQMEELLDPYLIEGGASGPYTDYDIYRNGDKTARLDGQDWWLAMNPSSLYRKALEKVISELGLESQSD